MADSKFDEGISHLAEAIEMGKAEKDVSQPTVIEQGLKYQFLPDLYDVFLNELEFADAWTFKITEDSTSKEFTIPVVWDTETLRNRVIVQQQGVFMGTVLVFFPIECFKVEPKPEQIIYRKIEAPTATYWEGWRVVDIVNAEECYELYLDKLMT